MPIAMSTRSSGPGGRSRRVASRRGSRSGWPVALTVGAGLLAVAADGPRALAVAAPLAAAVWGYDLALKSTSAGSAGMSACRGLDVLMGAAAHGAPRALPAAAVVAAHTAVVTEVSRREVTGGDPSVGRRALAATAAVAGAGALLSRGRLAALGLLGAYATVVGRAHADAAREPIAGAAAARGRRGDPRADAAGGRPAGGRGALWFRRRASRRCGRWRGGRRRSGRSREVRLRLQRAVGPPHRGCARTAGRERLLRRRADARPHPLRPVRAAAARAGGAAAGRARPGRARLRGGDRRAVRARSAAQALPDAAFRTAGLRRVDLLCTAVDVAVELGAPVVSMWSGVAPEGERAGPRVGPAWSTAASACSRTPIAMASRWRSSRSRGCSSRRWPTTRSCSGGWGTRRALGLTLDIGHIVCLEPMSVTECVRRGAETLAHVHIEDMRRGVHEHLMFGEGELDLDESLRVLDEVGFAGLVAVELSRHSHMAAHETVPAAMAALRAGTGGAVVKDLVRRARGRRATPEGLEWLRETSAAVAADPAALRAKFPMVGRKVGREPLEAGADPADVHAWTIDDAARTLLLVAAGRGRRGRVGRALPLRRCRRAARDPARAAVPGARRPGSVPRRRRHPYQRHAADRGRARSVRHRAPARRRATTRPC